VVFYDVFFEEYATNGEDLYVKTQRIETLFIVGNVTRLDIMEVTNEPFPDELFDPQQLKSPSSQT
jgi:hypothetical protein